MKVTRARAGHDDQQVQRTKSVRLSCGHLVRRISARSGAIRDQQRGPGAPGHDVIEPLATPPSTRTTEGKSSREI
jgi:hypothetical protein